MSLLKNALWSALLTFFISIPVLGVDIHQSALGLSLKPQWLHSFYTGLAAFVLHGLYLIIQQSAWFRTIRQSSPKKSSHHRHYHNLSLGVLILIGISLPFWASRGTLDIATLALVYVLLGLGLNIVVGFAGLLNLGYVGFYAIGAYTYAILQQYGYGFWTLLPLSGIIAALFGILLGFPILRLRGDYLAIVTLGFGEIIRLLLNNLDQFTKGPNGIHDIPAPTLFHLVFTKRAPEGYTPFHEWAGYAFNSQHRMIFLYCIILLFCILAVWIIHRLQRMPIGRAWEAIREDEIACRSLGINPTVAKLSAFAIGSLFAGIAGAFFAAKQGSISPESFTFLESAIILAIVVLGGMGSQLGVILAAIAITVLPELARNFSEYRMLIFGAVMVLMMIWRPQGLVPAQRPKLELNS
ncbi:MAG: high-affinity branched-chain amino acid ABC transporter permease LivM [Cardiobacteriaceae bacterium]|nr:high-affinity branched-chain amino acid ABC transporter permease LivM [Cardiobacteriaceae bacterium]